MIVASFSVPTVVACTMTNDRDCHEEMETKASDCCDMMDHSSHSNFSAEKGDHQEEGHSCEDGDCTLKQAPNQANTIELDQAQINVFAAIAATFIVSTAEPIITYSEKAQDFTTLYSDSSPIYLKNRVLLN
ncbi:MAG: hypothetical protein WEB89_07820 [Balneolales bacterium]